MDALSARVASPDEGETVVTGTPDTKAGYYNFAHKGSALSLAEECPIP